MYHPFSVTETIATAWKVLKKNFITLIVYSIVSLCVYGLVDFLNGFMIMDESIWSEFVFILVQMTIQSYLALSFYRLVLILIDKEFYEFSFKDVLPTFKMTINFVLVALLYVVLIGLFLFIDLLVERNFGVIFFFRLVQLIIILFLLLKSIFCVCFIVDDGSNPIESLKQSFEITKDNFFKTLGVFVFIIVMMMTVLIPVIILINIFGLDKPEYELIFKLAFYVWFLLTFPFVQVIIMVTYRKLVYSHLDVDDDITETV